VARPKLGRNFDEAEVGGFLELLRALAKRVVDPDAEPAFTSRDRKDDHLIAASASARATSVTGDADLLELEGSIPVLSPRAFLESLS
jgi:predicted nucleic acid-binding protein